MTPDELVELLKHEEVKRAIAEVIIADLRANGPTRMAMLGLFPEQREERKPDA